MQKLFFILFLLMPLCLMAQKQDAAKTAQQDAVNLFLQHYPNATKVDVAQRKIDQKGMHKGNNCGSCAKQQQQQTTNGRVIRSLATLQAEEQKIVQKITQLNSQPNPDMGLMQKYGRALILVKQDIAHHQAQAAQAKKIKTKK